MLLPIFVICFWQCQRSCVQPSVLCSPERRAALGLSSRPVDQLSLIVHRVRQAGQDARGTQSKCGSMFVSGQLVHVVPSLTFVSNTGQTHQQRGRRFSLFMAMASPLRNRVSLCLYSGRTAVAAAAKPRGLKHEPTECHRCAQTE